MQKAEKQKWILAVFTCAIAASFCFLVFALVTKLNRANELAPCENCDAEVLSPGSTHKTTCANCGIGVWTLCRGVTQHPHTEVCGDCQDSYYTCVSLPGSTEKTAKDHVHGKPTPHATGNVHGGSP